MSLGPRVRRAAYWALDAAKGSPVRHHYRDIEARMSDRTPGTARLEQLLDHAVRTVPYYSGLASDDLEAFPVVSRRVFKEHGDDLRSDAFASSQVHERTTSGTSGMPFEVALDATKRDRMVADVIYFNELAGQRIGDRLMWFRTWLQGAKTPLQRFVQNVVPYRVLGLDDAVLEDIVRDLRDQPINCILGNASTLMTISRYVERREYDPAEFHLQVAISTAETLDPGWKPRMAAAFGCPVVDRYANEENGLLASTTPGDGHFRLNCASFHFEFLKIDSDEPEAPGRLARIVLTDLYNRATPMIRYDTGDLAIVADVADGPATALASVQGRVVDLLYDTEGRELPTGAVAGIMQRFDDIARYQLVQEDATTFRLYVVLDGSRFREPDFRQRLEPWLGSRAELSIEFVDSIAEAESGKYKTVIANYRPDGTADRIGMERSTRS